MGKKIPNLITDNRFVILLADIPEKFRWIITTALIGLFLATWGLFFYLPLVCRLYRDKEQIRNNETQKIMLLQKVTSAEKIIKAKKSRTKALKNYSSNSEFDVAESIIFLAKKTHVHCSSITPLQLRKNKGYGYEISMNGKFKNVLLFLEELCEIKKCIDVKKFACQRVGHSKIEVKLNLEVPHNDVSFK